MTLRTTTEFATFRHPFRLHGVDRMLPPGDYRVDTDEELIDGMSFLAWRKVATSIHLPARGKRAAWSEVVSVSAAEILKVQADEGGVSLNPQVANAVDPHG